MSHWMQRVAEQAGLDGAEALSFERGASDQEIWAQTAEVCGVDEATLARAVASTFHVELADMAGAEATAARLLPGSVARKFGVFPVRDDEGNYLGVLECTQEIGWIQKLEGQWKWVLRALVANLLVALKGTFF